MADREKVIRELEQCLDDSVAAVVPADTVRDAIALLKSQDKDAEIIRKCRDGEVMKHVGNGVKGLNRVRRKTRPPIERTKKEITLSWVRSLIRLYPEMTLFEAEAYNAVQDGGEDVRLGDLDALYEEVADHVTSVSVCATVQQAIGQTDFKRRCLEDIRNVPTIDAIPVEWMRDKMRGYASVLKSTELKALVTVMQMWQKEQEGV